MRGNIRTFSSRAVVRALQDGAAGTAYISVTLAISGKFEGRQVRRSATAVLRRVNDVPGSTEAQRRWHIEPIDYSTAS